MTPAAGCGSGRPRPSHEPELLLPPRLHLLQLTQQRLERDLSRLAAANARLEVRAGGVLADCHQRPTPRAPSQGRVSGQGVGVPRSSGPPAQGVRVPQRRRSRLIPRVHFRRDRGSSLLWFWSLTLFKAEGVPLVQRAWPRFCVWTPWCGP